GMMQPSMNRREFTITALGAAASASAAPASFSFVHFTDTHIQRELSADDGCRLAFARINKLRPDFALCGGDLVFDAAEVERPRAIDLFNLYRETSKRLEMTVHTVPGNHDLVGLFTKSGVATNDPLYGKRMFEDRIGRRYGSFDHKGWHFVLLDSIGTTPDRRYIGRIDDEQLAWLRVDLSKIGRAPIVVVTHIPL